MPKTNAPSSFTSEDAQTLKVETVYKGFAQVREFEVSHKRFDGSWTPPLKRELFESGDAVVVLPYDPVSDQVVLVEQFRISGHARGINPWLLECIAGRIDEGETPEQVAIREAQEETKCALTNLVKIGEMFPSPGIFAEYAAYFCAKADTSAIGGIHGLETEHEDIRAHVLSFDEATQALETGRIVAAPAFICLQWLALNREELRSKWNSEA